MVLFLSSVAGLRGLNEEEGYTHLFNLRALLLRGGFRGTCLGASKRLKRFSRACQRVFFIFFFRIFKRSVGGVFLKSYSEVFALLGFLRILVGWMCELCLSGKEC